MDVGAGLDGIYWGSAVWGDYNWDGRLDILLAGYDESADVSKIYRNDLDVADAPPSAPSNLRSSLSGHTATLSWDAAEDTEQAYSGLTYNVRVGTTQGDSDVVSPMAIIGGGSDGTRLLPQMGNAGERTSYTLKDLPAGTYYWSVQAIDNGFAGSTFSSEGMFTVAFGDIGAGLPDVGNSSVAWGDYDSDGDLDALITGDTGTGYISEIYDNDGAGAFTPVDAGLTDVAYGSVAWGDYDSDGDLDILLAGDTGTGYVSEIYRNDAGVFTNIGAGLTGVARSSAAWGDYDQDGDLDIVLTGQDEPSDGTSKINRIYRNDGGGTFTPIDAGLPGVTEGSVAWGDYDSDGDLDLLLTGRNSAGDPISKIYRNDSGSFTGISAGLTDVYSSSVAWGDYDSDGDLDILLAGSLDHDSNSVSKIYRNDNGVFNDIGAGLTGARDGASAAWGDYDSDGDLDRAAQRLRQRRLRLVQQGLRERRRQLQRYRRRSDRRPPRLGRLGRLRLRRRSRHPARRCYDDRLWPHNPDLREPGQYHEQSTECSERPGFELLGQRGDPLLGCSRRQRRYPARRTHLQPACGNDAGRLRCRLADGDHRRRERRNSPSAADG